MNLDSTIGTIFIRDHYQYIRLYHATRIMTCIAIVIVVSMLGNLWLAPNPLEYRYIITTPVGRVMDMVPLNQPNMTDEQAIQWAIDATTKVNTFDFLNYRRQFQASQEAMTASGWKGYLDSLERSGNLRSILINKFVTTAVPTGPGVVISHQNIQTGGVQRFAWTIEFPMLITYRSSKQDTSQDLKMRVQVVRMPEYVNQSGVALRSILAK